MTEWRTIPSLGGYYEASDDGRVRSSDRTVLKSNGVNQPFKGKVLTPNPNPNCYPSVKISCPNRRSTMTVHVLIAEAFLGNRPEGYHTCHNDGNPCNNAPGNLRYDTCSGNAFDKRKHNTDYNVNKTHGKKCSHDLTDVKNLVKSRWERDGHRICLACSRARAHMAKYPDDDFEEVKKIKYEAIMR